MEIVAPERSGPESPSTGGERTPDKGKNVEKKRVKKSAAASKSLPSRKYLNTVELDGFYYFADVLKSGDGKFGKYASFCLLQEHKARFGLRKIYLPMRTFDGDVVETLLLTPRFSLVRIKGILSSYGSPYVKISSFEVLGPPPVELGELSYEIPVDDREMIEAILEESRRLAEGGRIEDDGHGGGESDMPGKKKDEHEKRKETNGVKTLPLESVKHPAEKPESADEPEGELHVRRHVVRAKVPPASTVKPPTKEKKKEPETTPTENAPSERRSAKNPETTPSAVLRTTNPERTRRAAKILEGIGMEVELDRREAGKRAASYARRRFRMKVRKEVDEG